MSKGLRSFVGPRAIPALKRICVQIRISHLTSISHQSQRARCVLPLHIGFSLQLEYDRAFEVEETSATSAAETPFATVLTWKVPVS
jgi:hypothetical protein